jgi:hypothetical protein
MKSPVRIFGLDPYHPPGVDPSGRSARPEGETVELDASTLELYVRHAFAGMDEVLDRLDDDTVNRKPDGWGTNSVAGLVVHCCELAPSWFLLPGLGRESTRNRDAEFATTGTIAELKARIERAVEQTCELVHAFDAGPTATDHELRAFMPGGDRTDGALALHVLEELFQHLGHMEVPADALGRPGDPET